MSLTAEPSVEAAPAVEDLAREVAAVIAAVGADLTPGPAGEQSDVTELVPATGGFAAAAEIPGIGVVAVLLSTDDAMAVDGAQGSWTAAVDRALESWGRAHGSSVSPLTPPCPANSVGELLPSAAGLTLIASGLFDGDRHAGTVALAVGPTAPVPNRPAAASTRSNGSANGSTAGMDAGPLQALATVEMSVTAELGRTSMAVSDLLGLAPGSLIELDRAAGSPIDLLVNGTLIARGEVVVIDEDFGLRLTEIVNPDEDRP